MPGKEQREAEGIRSFIAIDISPEVRNSMDEFIRELRKTNSDVKWVRVEGVHLTLKFLGNISQDKVGGIRDAITRAAVGIGPIEVKVEGAGAFPNLRKPRVFWAGVVEPSGVLQSLAVRLDDELKPLGFEPEEREFRPHLTLGRAKDRGQVDSAKDLISQESKRAFGSFTAAAVNLMKSELRSGGAVYTKLESVPLKSSKE